MQRLGENFVTNKLLSSIYVCDINQKLCSKAYNSFVLQSKLCCQSLSQRSMVGGMDMTS